MSSSNDLPPSYADATAPSSASGRRPRSQNGIPISHRRSMEDEMRPLPDGWVRSYDATTQHQFFVDTTKDPPRSIWHHPYDDDEYMNSLPEKERERIRSDQRDTKVKSMDGETDEAGPSTASVPTTAPEAPPHGLQKFGRKLKDKLTNTTHEEREARRRQEAAEEEQAYRRHLAFRAAIARAAETGQPQLLGKNAKGEDVYIEPPDGPRAPPGSYGYNPYNQGPYTDPNARFIRPDYPYSRPYGSGYGGGYGLPLAGGLLGGALLGSLLFTPF